jgi:hypothetical protein
MSTAKKCYRCLTEADAGAKACPKCGARLGARTPSGLAAKPGAPLLKLLFAALLLAAAGGAVLHSRSAPGGTSAVSISDGLENARDSAIRTIKEKGAGELGSVGVADVGYTEDTFCVYVDQRFKNLSGPQQEQLLGIVAGEWKKAIGKDSTTVKVLEYGTKKTLAELVV